MCWPESFPYLHDLHCKQLKLFRMESTDLTISYTLSCKIRIAGNILFFLNFVNYVLLNYAPFKIYFRILGIIIFLKMRRESIYTKILLTKIHHDLLHSSHKFITQSTCDANQITRKWCKNISNASRISEGKSIASDDTTWLFCNTIPWRTYIYIATLSRFKVPRECERSTSSARNVTDLKYRDGFRGLSLSYVRPAVRRTTGLA